jgi:hypothetical protein
MAAMHWQLIHLFTADALSIALLLYLGNGGFIKDWALIGAY